MIKSELKVLIKYYADVITNHNLDDYSLGLQIKRMMQLHEMIENKATKEKEELWSEGSEA
jgi:hypothetical protein